MKELVDLIANIGFPIAVSIYLLVRIEIKLEGLTNSINNLSQTINSIK
ncbi:MAG: YvrJ family protein [Clostridium sartagoforme]|nr:YvrJ family protein [Clostridium sartagoforme]